MSCESTTGKIEIDNYDALNNALYNNDGTVAITVTAEKSAYNVTSEILQRPVQPENTNAVYFSNANNWGEVYIHCWGGSSNISWPGIEMTPVIKNIHNEMVYRAYVPNDVTSIVFNNNDNGKLDFYFQAAILSTLKETLTEEDRLELAFGEKTDFNKVAFLTQFANFGAAKLADLIGSTALETMDNIKNFMVSPVEGRNF